MLLSPTTPDADADADDDGDGDGDGAAARPPGDCMTNDDFGGRGFVINILTRGSEMAGDSIFCISRGRLKCG